MAGFWHFVLVAAALRIPGCLIHSGQQSPDAVHPCTPRTGLRDGQLNDPRFGARMRGTGPLAQQIHQTFTVFARKYGLDRKAEPLNNSLFRPPVTGAGQQWLF